MLVYQSFISERLLQQYLKDRFGLDELRQKLRLLQTKAKHVELDATAISESQTLHHVTYWSSYFSQSKLSRH